MTPEKLTLGGFLTFVAMITAFLWLGPEAGIRLLGVVGLVGAVQALRVGRVGVGIEGYEPSFYFTGRAALIATVIGLLLFVILVARPDLFVGLVS